MSRLTAVQRRRLPASDFADPQQREYPILDQSDLAAVAVLLARRNASQALTSRAVMIGRRKGLAVPDSLLSNEARAGRQQLHDTLSKSGQVSTLRRDEIESAIAAGLTSVYSGERAGVLAQLGRTESAIPLKHRQKIAAFAAQRSRLIQSGTNSRLDAARNSTTQTVAGAQQKITEHNLEHLVPFLAAWATQQAILDAYRDTIDPSGKPASADRSWVWTQITDFDDDCTDAMNASPAPLDELVGIGHGEPPVHINCQCMLTPAD